MREVLYWVHTLSQEMITPETLCLYTSTSYTQKDNLLGKASRLLLNYHFKDTCHLASRNVFNT